MARPGSHGLSLAHRQMVLSIAKLLMLGLCQLPLLRAAPTHFVRSLADDGEEPEPEPPDSPTLWIYLVVALVLVLLGGAFAGLTIALMGQDEIYLQVIKTSGDGAEKNHAARVLRLLKRGKHWVLVTLLLGNVITNETLPIVLDRSLGGGWPAVLGSTVLIVIFGEIIPQSICVRFGLPIGAWMSPLVLVLMYILSPIAWPCAKLLDRLLGEDHGTIYKKAGLKTLVTLHKTLGAAGEQLNSDEVTIISAVLDLKEKSVGSIMTPMEDVFTMSADTILDEKTMDIILSAGYSRIPIHTPDNPLNFVGMLLVKILITYDPEDCKPVRDFALATLPETSPATSCLDIVNYFQEGKSHMVLVTDFPGEDTGALGVVTLEDVIEELIGEEIIDESDVFIDVHKAIRRMTPAPKFRVPKGEIVHPPPENLIDEEGSLLDVDDESRRPSLTPEATRKLNSVDGASSGKLKPNGADFSSSPKTVFLTRRASSINGQLERVPTRSDNPEMLEHLKHLGPSNLASKPKQTRYTTVKIKPGNLPDGVSKSSDSTATPRTMSMSKAPSGGVGEGLLNSAGKDAKDGVRAVQAGYGTISRPSTSTENQNKSLQVDSNPGPLSSSFGSVDTTIGPSKATLGQGNSKSNDNTKSRDNTKSNIESGPGSDIKVHQDLQEPLSRPPITRDSSAVTQKFAAGSTTGSHTDPSLPLSPRKDTAQLGGITESTIQSNGLKKVVLSHSTDDLPQSDAADEDNNAPESTVGSLQNRPFSPPLRKDTARSGSITENIIESGGLKKVVLETTSSSEDTVKDGPANSSAEQTGAPGNPEDKPRSGKKKRRRKRKKASDYAKAGELQEGTPLLDDDEDEPED